MPTTTSNRQIFDQLRDAGVTPTLQRLAIGAVLLRQPVHMTAEQVLAAAREHLPGLSRATVYSTLQMFVHHGLLRELPLDGLATVYDSNTRPHHHLYDIDTGVVADVPDGQLRVSGLPELAEGMELADIDVIIRVRSRKTDNPVARVH